jgi:hypothetical protein
LIGRIDPDAVGAAFAPFHCLKYPRDATDFMVLAGSSLANQQTQKNRGESYDSDIRTTLREALGIPKWSPPESEPKAE